MRIYTFSEARQNLAEVLDRAKSEEVIIKRRGGDTFVLVYKRVEGSPFDDVPRIEVPGLTADDIVEAVRYSREQPWRDEK